METREGEAAQTKRQRKPRSNGLRRAEANEREQHGNKRCEVRGQGGPGREERAREGQRKKNQRPGRARKRRKSQGGPEEYIEVHITGKQRTWKQSNKETKEK